MIVKVSRDDGTREAVYECSHIVIERKEESLEIDVCGLKGTTEKTLVRLPDDGDVLYQMNDDGDTTDTHRFAPKLEKTG